MKQSKHRNQSDSFCQSLAPYVRTLPIVVEAMLKLGNLTESDYLYDLGCGDGRILITAAQQYGLKGMGVDIDPIRIQEAKKRTQDLGLDDHVQFKQQDLMTVDLSPASVVSFYLLPSSNLSIREKLQTELAPGSRVITHSFDMGNWHPTKTAEVSDVINTYHIYLWEIVKR